MRIIIVGPVYPFRGGISHYTGLLAASFCKEHDVEIVSFSLQYPKCLYKKEQKDYDNDAFKFGDVRFIINTVNPISYIRASCYIKKQQPDLVLFQWWHPFFAPAFWTISKLLNRKRTKIIFLCHNVLPHEKFPFQKSITKAILKKGGQIVHSESEAQAIEAIMDAPIYEQTVLPTFDMFSTLNTHSRSDARKRLSLSESDQVLLFFGFIREYKGLKHLIKAMPDITAALPECKLLIVGDYFDGNKDEYLALLDNLAVRECVSVYDGYIPDSDVGLYFTACDVVVLPYESATQSGIAQVAYGFDKPVIATRVGGLPDVVAEGKTGYLVEPCNSKALTDAVIQFFSNDSQLFDAGIEAAKNRYSWDKMNEAIVRLYEKITL